MKTALLIVTGFFGLYSFFAGVQGKFDVCLLSTVIALGVLWMFFRRASAS